MSKGAALGAYGWHKRLARHGVIAAAMTDGTVLESWAKAIAQWTDPLPAADRDEADRILLEAAAAGVPLADLEILARSIWETWKAQHPDPDDGNGEPGDEDGFEDRRLRLGVTFGGAGKLTGDLAAGCAAKLQAIFDALGKHLGADDWRSMEQRQHDALDEALSRLIKSGLLPQSAGTDTLAQVIIPFPALRGLPGASPAEEQWMAGTAGQPGWLTGIGAEAAACDATIVPMVTGTVDWQAVDDMTQVWIGAHGLDRGREPCGCTCGGCTCTPPAPLDAEAKARLRRTLLAMAADAMSGPTGLAAYLRSRLLGAPYNSASLPLDVGRARDIPDHIRRAVILRDKHCGWPGGCDVGPAGCEIHHLATVVRGRQDPARGPEAVSARSTTRCAFTAAAGKSSCTPTAPARPSPRGEKSFAATARQAIELRYERCPPSCGRGGSCPRGHRAGPSRVLHRRRAREGRARCGQSRGLGHHR